MIILVHKVKSNRRIARAGGNVTDQGVSSLGVKVLFMIGSQLISWSSLIIATLYYRWSGEVPEQKVFGIFALFVVPINSLLNPVFYSKLYQKILGLLTSIKDKICAFGQIFKPQ